MCRAEDSTFSLTLVAGYQSQGEDSEDDVLLVPEWDEGAERTLHHCHMTVCSSSPRCAKLIRSECDGAQLLPIKAPPADANGNKDENILDWDENGENVCDSGNVVRPSLNGNAEFGRCERENVEGQRKVALQPKSDENTDNSEDEDVLPVGEYDPDAEEEEEVKRFEIPLPTMDREETAGWQQVNIPMVCGLSLFSPLCSGPLITTCCRAYHASLLPLLFP